MWKIYKHTFPNGKVCKGKRKQAYGYKWRYANYE